MNTQDILAELPRLSVEEREAVAKVLRHLSADLEAPASRPVIVTRLAGLHAGAWEVAPDFDAPLPDVFWLGEDA